MGINEQLKSANDLYKSMIQARLKEEEKETQDIYNEFMEEEFILNEILYNAYENNIKNANIVAAKNMLHNNKTKTEVKQYLMIKSNRKLASVFDLIDTLNLDCSSDEVVHIFLKYHNDILVDITYTRSCNCEDRFEVKYTSYKTVYKCVFSSSYELSVYIMGLLESVGGECRVDGISKRIK